jgi:NADH:ubiquinone oxidoreductase subunit F (NADH-binding)/NAD-dependent dihydropyrimidine dehydrogenase PreA subunit
MAAKIALIKDTAGSGTDRTRDIYAITQKAIREKGLEQTVQAVRAADIGLYKQGVVVKILPYNIVYVNIEEADVAEILDKTVVAGEIIERLTAKDVYEQMRIVLRNCGKIDPESIDEFLSVGGYQGIKKCLFDMTPEKVIEEFKVAGLRGRGGAGYPSWLKWNLARNSTGTQKYVICNGDEGDPGAYMDRSVLEGDPHSVIEGMMVVGFAIGASKGFLYIRAEYPLAIDRLRKALDQAYEKGLLGANILGSSFTFDLDIRLGAGAFVCGEETALIASIEGKRGTPRPRPPYPSDAGLWDKPSVINNVETLANIPVILIKGGAWFCSIGTDKSKGTKVFALTGKIKNSGLVEIPMGTPLRAIVEGIGGGVGSDKKILAIQTGGPSGGVIPEKHFDSPVSYEHLQALGSIMGSGGMIVMDEADCLVDIAKFYLGFCVDESCGKCAPCKIGGYQMLHVLDRIAGGKGAPSDIEVLRRIAKAMQKASLCGLGQSAPNPILSTLNYFEQEYIDHIQNKKCRAAKCAALCTYEIIQEKCKRCTLCVKECPAGAIPGDRQKGFIIDATKCITCGQCFMVCRFNAVAKG